LASNLSNLHIGFDVAMTPGAFKRREPPGTEISASGRRPPVLRPWALSVIPELPVPVLLTKTDRHA